MRILFTLCIAPLLLLVLTKSSALSQSVEFPVNAGQLNVKEYGAVGDGVTDDTEAFQRAIDENYTFCGGRANNFRFLYIPDGTYLVSDEIFWMRWVTFQGQSKANTIIKLKDNCPGYQDPAQPKPVLRCRFTGLTCSPFDGSNNSSFANYIQDLTVDVGRGNPGAIGIRYNNHNSGAVRNVTIRSSDEGYAGAIGLDMSETEFGPGLIKNLSVDGFDVGIKTPGLPSHATFENTNLSNQQTLGFQNNLPVSIHRLSSTNQVPVIQNGPSVLAQLVLVEGTFQGDADTSAIVNQGAGTVVLRNLTATGYDELLIDQGTVVAESTIDEYITGEKNLLNEATAQHLALPIEEAPAPPYEPTANWAFVDPSAADDTENIQKAIDSGARTIYFQFGADYIITSTVVVRGNVERIVGMNAAVRSQADNFDGGATPMFRMENTAPVSVEFLTTSQFPNFKYAAFEVNTAQAVSLLSCLTIRNNTITNTALATDGTLFLEDTHMNVDLDYPMQVWARHYNVENNPAGQNIDLVYYQQRGGTGWILGMKTEGIATHVEASEGAEVELLGGFFRDQINYQGVPPYFKVNDARLSAAYWQYDCCGDRTRNIAGISIQDGDSTALEVTPRNHIVGIFRAGSDADSSSDSALDPTVGEVGVSTATDQYQSVSFKQSYQNPSVFVGPLGFNGKDPATIRVNNVTNEGFDWRVDEWEYLDQSHLPEEVSYLVVEGGVSQLNDMTWQAGRAEVDTRWVNVRFEEAFAAPPVVLPQVVTENEAEAVAVRVRNVTTTGFELLLQEEEGGGSHTTEIVHWIAVETGNPGSEPFLESSVTGRRVSSQFSNVPLSRSSDASQRIFLGHSQSAYGSDPGALRFSKRGSDIAVLYQEEASNDAETAHTTEEVGILQLERPTVLNAPVAVSSPAVQDTGIYLFPNPVQDALQIRVPNPRSAYLTVELLNEGGNALPTPTLQEGDVITVDMTRLNPGIYYVKVRTKAGVVTKRIVRE